MYPVSQRLSISMQRPLRPSQSSPEHVQVQELCAQVTVLTRQAIPAALWWASGPSSVRFPVDCKLLVIPPGATGCILKPRHSALGAQPLVRSCSGLLWGPSQKLSVLGLPRPQLIARKPGAFVPFAVLTLALNCSPIHPALHLLTHVPSF